MGILRLRAVLNLPKQNFPVLGERATAIHTGFSEHPELFVTPHPSLFILGQKTESFLTAQQKAGTYKGSIAVRNLKASELITCLETARRYVQELVDANPEQGLILINGAGMRVGKATEYSKPLLQAKQSQPGGPVQLIANVGLLTDYKPRKVFFNWQFSVDGGQTWLGAPPTLNGNTTLDGLTPQETYAFRVSVTRDQGSSYPWSQMVTLLVR